MIILFWERWLIKWAMRKLSEVLPIIKDASYGSLERYGIADLEEKEVIGLQPNSLRTEIFVLPLGPNTYNVGKRIKVD